MSVVEMCGVLAEEYDKPLILQPAPVQTLSPRLLRRINTITPNQEELLELTEKGHIEEGALHFQSLGCKRVAVNLGLQGAFILDEDGKINHLPAPAIHPISTVGARDCFNGWLAVELGQGKSFKDAAYTAVQAASLFISREGLQDAFPTRDEVHAFEKMPPLPEKKIGVTTGGRINPLSKYSVRSIKK